MATKRFTAAERAQWRKREPYGTEPALGTLDERLGIIIRRQGGLTGTPRPHKWERDYAAHLLARLELAS